MVDRVKNFIKTSLLGGFAVILPITILILIFKWIYNFIIQIIHPLTQLVVSRSDFQKIAADVIVLGIILSSCFLVGVFIRTRLGRFIQKHFDNGLSRYIPGYGLIRSTVRHFFERKNYPFSSVALVQAFENDTLMTAFVVDKHSDGRYTVFVPCGPNPTTGYIFHMKPQYVHPVPVPVEDTFRSVISCGVGSKPLLDAFQNMKGSNQR